MIPDSVNGVAQAIQLALGPAFLLTAIAGMLNVMTGRLSRIIDRGRVLVGDGDAREPLTEESLDIELGELERRRSLTSAAITACTIAALLICMVIVSLFVELVLQAPLYWFIGALFTTATIALVIGLAFFLREVHLATKTVRIPKPRLSK